MILYDTSRSIIYLFQNYYIMINTQFYSTKTIHKRSYIVVLAYPSMITLKTHTEDSNREYIQNTVSVKLEIIPYFNDII